MDDKCLICIENGWYITRMYVMSLAIGQQPQVTTMHEGQCIVQYVVLFTNAMVT